eukprot:6137048-Amphidinium_carterae.1
MPAPHVKQPTTNTQVKLRGRELGRFKAHKDLRVILRKHVLKSSCLSEVKEVSNVVTTRRFQGRRDEMVNLQAASSFISLSDFSCVVRFTTQPTRPLHLTAQVPGTHPQGRPRLNKTKASKEA